MVLLRSIGHGQHAPCHRVCRPRSAVIVRILGRILVHVEHDFTGARKRGYAGRILLADGGTLFLDEIGDMPLNLQARLLRVLQERVVVPLGGGRAQPVDSAIICATHRRLKEAIAEGRFREDLYYRLNGLQVKLPALRTAHGP